MTIIQQPDSLSLSGNLKDFHIATSDKISFLLQYESENALAQSYEPGQNGVIIISLKDIIHSCLSFHLQETAQVYQQPSIAGTFTARFSDDDQAIYTDVTFRVIRSGVDRLADTPTNFLTQNFLTWQPSVKAVTYYSPEFLTYYAVVPCTAQLRAYFTDPSGSATTQQDITLATFDAGKAYTIPLQYASVAEKLGNRLPSYYDVWIESPSAARLTYIQRYYASDMLSEQEQWILFENSLGGIDTFRAYGSTDFTADHTHNIAEIDEISSEYRVDTARKFQKNTGHLTNQQRRWLLDFFPSQAKYIYSGTYLRPIVVSESNVTYTDRELPSAYTFTYKYADARPLLNLPRTDIPSEALHITVPTVGSFTVPPRLVEFPRLPLTEGALFPTQNPYSEDWSTATAGSLSDFIASRLTENYGSGGGIGHQHKNIDLLQLLTLVNEYLLVAGKKIKAGYADKAGSIDGLEKLFISKLGPDQTDHLLKLLGGALVQGGLTADTLDSTEITTQLLEVIGKLVAGKASFSGDISSFDYAEKMLGWIITASGRAEFQSLRVNGFFEADEFRYNRVSVITGEQWNAPGGGIIESVDIENQIIYLKLEPGEPAAVELDDISKANFNNSAEFQTCFFRITEKIGDSAFKYVLRSGFTVHPCAFMHFVSYGNFTNKERQHSSYSTKSYKRYLTGVNNWEFTKDMIAMQLGDLSNLKLFGIDMTGHSAYLKNIYMTGTIKQLSSDNVTESQVPCFKGEWITGKYWSYDEVTHDGSTWLCIAETTTQEPSESATDWLETSAKGKDAVVVNMISSNGNVFQNGSVSTVITVQVMKGDKDITSSIPANRFSWEKQSKNADTDKIFNETHVGHGHTLEITPDDIYGRATFDCIVNL